VAPECNFSDPDGQTVSILNFVLRADILEEDLAQTKLAFMSQNMLCIPRAVAYIDDTTFTISNPYYNIELRVVPPEIYSRETV
jgi:hypothetical protein